MILDVPWRRVRPMDGQPREHFDAAGLAELATSIGAVGQVVPALVVELDGDRRHDYELVDGQRRWHAVQLAGVATLRVQVLDEPDEERRYIRSVVANLAREGLHALEIAVACDRLRRGLPATEKGKVARVAAIIGKPEEWVYRHLALLNLCDEVKAALHPTAPKARRLPFSAAYRLASLDHDAQRSAYAAILASGVSPLRALGRALDEAREGEGGADAVPAVATTAAGARHRKERAYDALRHLRTLARNLAHDLDGAGPARLAADLRGPHPELAREVVEALRAVHARIGALIEAAGGASP